MKKVAHFYPLWILISFLNSHIPAQASMSVNLDSLQASASYQAIQWETPEEFDIFDSLMVQYEESMDDTTLIHYYEIALEKAEQLKNDSLTLRYIIYLYPYYEMVQRYDKNEENALKDVEIARRANNQEYIAIAYNELGLSRKNQNKYNAALDAFLEGVEQSISLQEKDILTSLYSNIATCYRKLGQVEEAIKVIQKVIKIQKSSTAPPPLKNNYLLGNYNVLLSCYVINNDTTIEKKLIETVDSLAHISEGYLSASEYKVEFSTQIFVAYSYICQHYLNIGDLGQAKIYYEKVESLGFEKPSHKKILDFQYYLVTKDYQKVATLLEQYSYQTWEESEEEFLRYLARFYAETNDLEKYIATLQQIYQSKIDLLEKNNTSLIAYNEVKLDNVNKENELLQAKIKNSDLKRRNAIAIGLSTLLLFFTLFYLFRSKQIKKKNVLIQENLAKSQQLTEQSKELATLSADRNKLLVNIAHEFQTPLSVIIGLSDQLHQTATDSNDPLHEQMAIISGNAQSISHHISNMLEDARIASHKRSLSKTSFNLIDLCKQIIASFNFLVQQRAIQINLDSSSLMHPIISSDKEKISAIIKNLISNAIKHTPEKKIISIFLVDKGRSYTEILINDTGYGIPQKEKEYIFNRFYQAINEEKGRSGFGLGLSICKEYTEQLGGDISFTSVLNQGTTFSVKLPVEKIAASSLINTPASDVIVEKKTPIDFTSPVPPKKERATILIVEDSQDFSYFLNRALSKQFRLFFAKNAQEAKGILQSNKVELVLSDWMMAGGDGEMLIQYMKQQDSFSGIPILLLTAKSLISHKVRMEALGVKKYLTKPIKSDELIKEIFAVLDHQNYPTEATNNISLPLDELKIRERQFLLQFEDLVYSMLSDPTLVLDDIANALNLSNSQLNRRIKSITKTGTKAYINELRYWEARRIMEEGKAVSVKDVCLSVGFKDVKNFSRNFKKRFDKYPREYM